MSYECGDVLKSFVTFDYVIIVTDDYISVYHSECILNIDS